MAEHAGSISVAVPIRKPCQDSCLCSSSREEQRALGTSVKVIPEAQLLQTSIANIANSQCGGGPAAL